MIKHEEIRGAFDRAMHGVDDGPGMSPLHRSQSPVLRAAMTAADLAGLPREEALMMAAVHLHRALCRMADSYEKHLHSCAVSAFAPLDLDV